MKSFVALALLASAATVALPRDAAAIGCISGAAMGGVAGHYAGRHGLLGAAAGCAAGHHAKVVQRRRAAEALDQQNGAMNSPGQYQQNGAMGGQPQYQQ